jgi:hypothetical protein
MNMYDKTFADVFAYLGKRIVMLAAKLCGFKSCCLMLATVLLEKGVIGDDVWLTVIITVICATGGLRLADAYAAAGTFIRRGPRVMNKGDNSYGTETEEDMEDRPLRYAGHSAAGSGARRAAADGKARIRALLGADSTGGTDGNKPGGAQGN